MVLDYLGWRFITDAIEILMRGFKRKQPEASFHGKVVRVCPGCGIVFVPPRGCEHYAYHTYQCYRRNRRRVKNAAHYYIFSRDNFTCVYCGKTPLEGAILEVDHLFPEIDGGKSTQDNLVTACRTCNRRKSRKHLPPEYFHKLQAEIRRRNAKAKFKATGW